MGKQSKGLRTQSSPSVLQMLFIQVFDSPVLPLPNSVAQNVQECTAEVRETEQEEGCGERTQEISHLEKGGRVSMKVLEDMVQRRQEKAGDKTLTIKVFYITAS